MTNFNVVPGYLSQAPALEASELLQLSAPTEVEGYQSTTNVGVGKHAC